MCRAVAIFCASAFILLTLQIGYAVGGEAELIHNANQFEKEGLYDLAFNQLLQCASEENSVACIQRMKLFIDDMMKALPEWKNKALTVFIPKEVSMKDYWEVITICIASAGVGGAVDGAGSLAATVGGFSLVAVPTAIAAPFVYIWSRDSIQVSKEEAEKIIVEEIKKANEYLNQCDRLQNYISQTTTVPIINPIMTAA